MRHGRVVIVVSRGGVLSVPVANAVPDVAGWVAEIRRIAGDAFVGAVVADLTHPTLRARTR